MTNKLNIYIIKVIIVLLAVATNTATYADNLAKKTVVDYYGYNLKFSITSDFYQPIKNSIKLLSIEQQAFLLANDSQIIAYTKEANAYAESFKLDDLGYLLLVKKTAKTLAASQNKNFTTLFCYAALYQKGFDLLLGINKNDETTLYGTTNFAINNILFVNINNAIYYDLSFDQKKEPTEERLANLLLKNNQEQIKINRLTPPLFNKTYYTKTYPFEYDDNLYFFSTLINKSLVAYYNDLPDIEMSLIYLNYGLSEKGSNTLANQLKEATAYMNKEKTVSFILNFVQSLSYAKDIDVLGKEKFAFPEEALSNNFSDCEDRSMLFAYLVREVANLQSIGLLYYNAQHMNVAVENWRKTAGDIKVYDMDFIICEPTGKGYKVGEQTMNTISANIVKW